MAMPKLIIENETGHGGNTRVFLEGDDGERTELTEILSIKRMQLNVGVGEINNAILECNFSGLQINLPAALEVVAALNEAGVITVEVPDDTETSQDADS